MTRFLWLQRAKNVIKAHEISIVCFMASIRITNIEVLNLCCSKFLINIFCILNCVTCISAAFTSSKENLGILKVVEIINTVSFCRIGTRWKRVSILNKFGCIDPVAMTLAMIVNDSCVSRASDTVRDG
jgi:hypothetical protein